MIDELGFATSLYTASGLQGGGASALNFPPLNCATNSVAGGGNEISSKYNYINVFSKNCLIFI